MADKEFDGAGLVDMHGTQLHVGDTLAVAFRSGSSAHLRVGEITGFWLREPSYWSGASDDLPLIELEWKNGYVKSSKMETHKDRYLVVK